MNSASILIKTDPKLKKEAQKTAEDMGISLTSVINRYLKHFVQNKEITFSTGEENPTGYFLEGLREAEDDIKSGRVVSFRDKQDVLSYLDREIKNETRSKA